MQTEDELQNVEMDEEERRKKNAELRIKKRDYTGYDDEEFADGQAGIITSLCHHSKRILAWWSET